MQHDLNRILDLDAIRAEKARRHLKDFVKWAWPILEPNTTFKDNWHIDAMCDHLEAVTRGDILKLIINVPPGCMKSLLVCVLWPAWEWASTPHIRWMFSSYASTLSLRDSIKFTDLVNSQEYQKAFGNKFDLKKETEALVSNNKTGFRFASSVGGVGTGERVHRNVNDDLIRSNDAYSEAQNRQALEHMKSMSTRGVDPATYSQVLIMQRLSETDPTAWALDQGWESLILPMEYEVPKGAKPRTSIGFTDPRKKEGELLWANHFPADTLKVIKKSLLEYGTAAQLQQRPQPLGGGLFKTKYWNEYTDESIPVKFHAMLIYSDTAQKTKEHNDYSVFVFVGLVRLGKEKYLYVLDVKRDRFEADDLLAQALLFWNKHKHQGKVQGATLFKVEDKSSGTGLIQQLTKRVGSSRVKGIPRNTDKLSRAMGCISEFAEHRVFLPKGATRYSDGQWVTDFKKEFASFSPLMNHAHDDQIDPVLDAVEDLLINDAYNMYANL